VILRTAFVLISFCFCLEAKKFNVVFLLADDMGRDTWGAYGSKDCQTPNIDLLADEGTRFDLAYCSVAMCAPFRQELYSGRSPWRTGTLPNHSKSAPGTQSIPHYLKPLGYRVALLGKSHVGPKECYPFEMLGDVSKKIDANPEILKRSSQFLDDCQKNNEPFCLFIASHDSHAPFTTGDQSAYDANKLTVPPYWVDTPELRNEMVKYYAEVTNFDSLVGIVRAELEKRNLWGSTIFIVCSEQGTQLPFAKWTCYDNGLHIGLVLRWPGLSKEGSVVEELVSIVDITPTLVQELGGNFEEGDCDGKNIASLIRGNDDPVHQYVCGAFTNCRIMGNRDRIFPIRSIRDKRYSLIFNPNFKDEITSNITLSRALEILKSDQKKKANLDPAASWVIKANPTTAEKKLVHKLHHRKEYELYDLRNDPFELVNLIGDPKFKKVGHRLKQALHKKLGELGDADPIRTEKKLL
jgi:N-sulfoglucosamine sulfohydrolase